jgi:hypothetical protein
MTTRSLTPLTRVCALAALVVLGCAFSLVGAKSAPAALSWSSSASCVPCFDVAMVVGNTGHVSGVSPGSPDAGRIECQEQVVNGQLYDCEFYFLWLDGDPTVILTATGPFIGWEPGNETSIGCPQLGPAANQCTLNLDNTPLGTCIKATFTGETSTFGACPTEPPVPPGCSPNCGPSPPPPPPPPPPPAILNTTFLAKPFKTTRKRTATFRWAAYRSGHKVTTGVRSQCRLDKQTLWRSCKSPRYLTRLKPGYHTMRVRVGDSVGAASVRWDKTPATYTWRIKR